MPLPPITLKEAQETARSGDLARVRETGHQLMLRGACWEPAHLTRIGKRLGENGVIAALDGDNAQEAARNLTKLTGYLGQKRACDHWTKSHCAHIWIALCEQNTQTVATALQCRDEVLWDAIASSDIEDPAVARALILASEKGLGSIQSKNIEHVLLHAVINKKSIMWHGILTTIGMERLTEKIPTQLLPGHPPEPSPVIARLLS